MHEGRNKMGRENQGLRKEIKGTKAEEENEKFRGEIRGADSAKERNEIHEGENKNVKGRNKGI